MTKSNRFESRRQHVEYVPLGKLTPDPKNARKHSRAQLAKLAAGISQMGFVGAIITNEEFKILAGHARFDAARQLGYEVVPVIRISDLTPAERKAFALADNKIGDLSSFDDDLLREALIELEALDFEVELTGFDTAEIDLIVDGLPAATSQPDPDDAVIERSDRVVTRSGDLWHLGEHRIFCGDALDDASFERILRQNRAEIIFVDPPYNVKINGHVSGKGKHKHQEFSMAAGEMSPA